MTKRSTLRERVELIQGDITTQRVDVIVNAANSSLLGGGGVDGAIHRAAGPELKEECRGLGGCPTGEAKITGAYRLPAKHVIHTVGPVWKGGDHEERRLLANCYRNSLTLAADYGAQSVAFPAISCGAYGFPLEEAATIAVREVHSFLANHDQPSRVILACFDRRAFDAYERALAHAGK